MSKDYKADLKYEAVLLSIAMLLGGNRVIQDAFEQFLLKDLQNQFILNLHEIIQSSFDIVSKKMTR